MKSNPKNHLARLGLAGAFILTALGFLASPSAAHSATISEARATISEAHPGLSLYLSNEFAGTLISVEGGDVVAPVLVAMNQAKHIGSPKQEPIIIRFGAASVTKKLFAWLADTLAGTAMPVDGTISDQGYTGEFLRLTFSRAVITEIQFPALDGASNIPPVITVVFQPLSTLRTFSAVKSASPAFAPPCNFQVEFPTLDSDGVRKVSAFVFKRNYSDAHTGESRYPGSRLSPPIIPNLVLTLSARHAASYQTWFEDFVLKGNCGANQEKQGSLRFVDRRSEEIFSLNFSHVGIVRLSLELPQGRDLVPECRVEMYCGGLALSPGPKLAQTQPAGSGPITPSLGGTAPDQKTFNTPGVNSGPDTTLPPQNLSTPPGITPLLPASVPTEVGARNASGISPDGAAPVVPATRTRATLGLPNKFERPSSGAAASPPNMATSPPPASATTLLLPITSVSPTPPRSGNYLVTINALWCNKPTPDDPLQFDGKGDEIYCAAYVRRYDRRTFQLLEYTIRQTREYGDANHSDRIQAGSRSALGGIQDRDSIPDQASAVRLVPAQESLFPLKVWQGTLTDGADALVLSPSIWESDGEPSYFYKWGQKQMQLNDTLFLSSVLQEQIQHKVFGAVELGATESIESLAATSLKLTVLSIPAALGGVPPVHFFLTAHDGPIGLLRGTGNDDCALPNTTVVLTREIIESALSSASHPTVVNPALGVSINVSKPGILIITFRDRPANPASPYTSERWINYSMALQVERVP